MRDTDQAVLEVRHLKAYYRSPYGEVQAVDGVSFDLRRGETVCLVGESGCGKTATALSILRLIERLQGHIVGGQVLYHGDDLLQYPEERVRRLRGRHLALIFQDPQTALNPVLRVSDQIAEPMRLHLGFTRGQARERAIALMREIGIPQAERRIDEYPHQFSGGMKQRVLIATALSCDPDILIADEPTTALDVTTKAQILDIFRHLKQNRDMSVIFVTHDLGVVAEIADRIVVMYAGRVAEAGSVTDIFDDPHHPYTQGLLRCLPDISRPRERLESIPGSIPSLLNPPDNCIYNPRCSHVMEVCRRERPPEYLTGPGRRVACFLHSHHPVSSPESGAATGG
ncbi:MAG: ABC transporter ATP-binding protein [Dehalococcoidia bacterium]